MYNLKNKFYFYYIFLTNMSHDYITFFQSKNK
jgi:hypothetical protein